MAILLNHISGLLKKAYYLYTSQGDRSSKITHVFMLRISHKSGSRRMGFRLSSGRLVALISTQLSMHGGH